MVQFYPLDHSPKGEEFGCLICLMEEVFHLLAVFRGKVFDQLVSSELVMNPAAVEIVYSSQKLLFILLRLTRSQKPNELICLLPIERIIQ